MEYKVCAAVTPVVSAIKASTISTSWSVDSLGRKIYNLIAGFFRMLGFRSAEEKLRAKRLDEKCIAVLQRQGSKKLPLGNTLSGNGVGDDRKPVKAKKIDPIQENVDKVRDFIETYRDVRSPIVSVNKEDLMKAIRSRSGILSGCKKNKNTKITCAYHDRMNDVRGSSPTKGLYSAKKGCFGFTTDKIELSEFERANSALKANTEYLKALKIQLKKAYKSSPEDQVRLLQVSLVQEKIDRTNERIQDLKNQIDSLENI